MFHERFFGNYIVVLIFRCWPWKVSGNIPWPATKLIEMLIDMFKLKGNPIAAQASILSCYFHGK